MILSRRLGNHLIGQARGGRGFVPGLAIDSHGLKPVADKLLVVACRVQPGCKSGLVALNQEIEEVGVRPQLTINP